MSDSSRPPGSSAAPRRVFATDSPCISICTLDASLRVCVGCFRTIEEIAAWGTLADDEKRAINAQLVARRREHEESHGKR